MFSSCRPSTGTVVVFGGSGASGKPGVSREGKLEVYEFCVTFQTFQALPVQPLRLYMAGRRDVQRRADQHDHFSAEGCAPTGRKISNLGYGASRVYVTTGVATGGNVALSR